MSILGNILDSIRATFSNETVAQAKLRELRHQLMNSVEDASEDGDISPEEVQQIMRLMDKLNIDEKSMNDVKLKILRDLVNHILKDEKIKTGEIELLNAIENVLNAKTDELVRLKNDIEKIKQMSK